jgi:hypothetical protein
MPTIILTFDFFNFSNVLGKCSSSFSVASSKSKTKSALFILLQACFTIDLSTDLFASNIPGVSKNTICALSIVVMPLIMFLVV